VKIVKLQVKLLAVTAATKGLAEGDGKNLQQRKRKIQLHQDWFASLNFKEPKKAMDFYPNAFKKLERPVVRPAGKGRKSPRNRKEYNH
jgi:hypothetical protein